MLGQYLTRAKVDQVRRTAAARPDRWLQFDPASLRQQFDREPFLLRHTLAGRPELQLPALFGLCRRRPDLVNVRRGSVPVTEDFLQSFAHHGTGCTLEQTIERFEALGAYILIVNPELDAQYRALLELLLGEVAEVTAALDAPITWYSTYFFLSTQHAVTPYHMDRELNFLLQIQGTKHVQLWDPRDDEIMTPAQKDELLAYAKDLRPPYRDAFAAKARHFELPPGLGVHHPFLAPHIVRTESALSVSLAFTWRTQRTDRCTNAHRMNHALRKWGMSPWPVGAHPFADRVKSIVVRAGRALKAVPGLARIVRRDRAASRAAAR